MVAGFVQAVERPLDVASRPEAQAWLASWAACLEHRIWVGLLAALKRDTAFVDELEGACHSHTMLEPQATLESMLHSCTLRFLAAWPDVRAILKWSVCLARMWRHVEDRTSRDSIVVQGVLPTVQYTR